MKSLGNRGCGCDFASRLNRLRCAALVCSTILFGAAHSASGEGSAGWELVWADEFDAPGRPDPAIWSHEIGFVRNEELQYFTDNTKNARVEDGMLVIEAHREQLANAEYDAGSDHWSRSREVSEYTSASLTTRGKKSLRYGRVEVRARLPRGRGVWPAIWMLGRNHKEVGWPLCGEIDILEYVGFDPGHIHGTFHTEAYNHMNKNQKASMLEVSDVTEAFHVYGVQWDEERIAITFDRQPYSVYEKPEGATVEEWPFDAPHFLLMNFSVGGAWGGMQGVDPSVYPQRFEIDYIRVYERKP